MRLFVGDPRLSFDPRLGTKNSYRSIMHDDKFFNDDRFSLNGRLATVYEYIETDKPFGNIPGGIKKGIERYYSIERPLIHDISIPVATNVESIKKYYYISRFLQRGFYIINDMVFDLDIMYANIIDQMRRFRPETNPELFVQEKLTEVYENSDRDTVHYTSEYDRRFKAMFIPSMDAHFDFSNEDAVNVSSQMLSNIKPNTPIFPPGINDVDEIVNLNYDEGVYSEMFYRGFTADELFSREFDSVYIDDNRVSVYNHISKNSIRLNTPIPINGKRTIRSSYGFWPNLIPTITEESLSNIHLREFSVWVKFIVKNQMIVDFSYKLDNIVLLSNDKEVNKRSVIVIETALKHIMNFYNDNIIRKEGNAFFSGGVQEINLYIKKTDPFITTSECHIQVSVPDSRIYSGSLTEINDKYKKYDIVVESGVDISSAFGPYKAILFNGEVDKMSAKLEYLTSDQFSGKDRSSDIGDVISEFIKS